MENPTYKISTGWGCLILVVIWFILMLMSGLGPGDFREAADRSKISRTKANQRTFTRLTEEASRKNSLDFMTHRYWGPMTQEMTQSISSDPKGFCNEFNRKIPFQIWSDGKGSFAVIDRGPDQQLEITKDMLDNLDQTKPLATRTVQLNKYSYDPSNGSRSTGDIIMLKWLDDDPAQQTQSQRYR